MDEGTDAKDILENKLLPLRRGESWANKSSPSDICFDSNDSPRRVVQVTLVWSIAARKTSMGRRTFALLWLQRGSSSSPTLPTGTWLSAWGHRICRRPWTRSAVTSASVQAIRSAPQLCFWTAFFSSSAIDQPHQGHAAWSAQQTPESAAFAGEGSGGIQELPPRWPSTQDQGSAPVSVAGKKHQANCLSPTPEAVIASALQAGAQQKHFHFSKNKIDFSKFLTVLLPFAGISLCWCQVYMAKIKNLFFLSCLSLGWLIKISLSNHHQLFSLVSELTDGSVWKIASWQLKMFIQVKMFPSLVFMFCTIVMNLDTPLHNNTVDMQNQKVFLLEINEEPILLAIYAGSLHITCTLLVKPVL